jgi:hypothetical protein
MGGLLFVSQAMLDSWADQGKIDFVANVMTVLAGEGNGRNYALEPAVRFMKVLGADSDPNGLLHKVKTNVQLKELGAEPVDDSCILGDLAYEVQAGFLAEAAAIQAAATAEPEAPPVGAPSPIAAARSRQPSPAATRGGAASSAAPAVAAPGARSAIPLGKTPLPRDLEEKRKEAEALARFLLENFS